MNEQTAAAAENISIDEIESLLAEEGYEVVEVDESVLNIKDLETGVSMQAALENNVLFMTISCKVVPAEEITPDVMRSMLDAENGISTSSFQLYERKDGKVSITLNNFCKLQSLGAEDRDDILSCLEFLFVDVMAANKLLGGS